jgi:hypothetical protein
VQHGQSSGGSRLPELALLPELLLLLPRFAELALPVLLPLDRLLLELLQVELLLPIELPLELP